MSCLNSTEAWDDFSGDNVEGFVNVRERVLVSLRHGLSGWLQTEQLSEGAATDAAHGASTHIDEVNPAYTTLGGIIPGVLIFPPAIPAAVGGQLTPFFAAGVPLLPSVQATTDDDQFSPSLTLDYRWSPDVMTYLCYSKGFKGGGFTLPAFPPIIPGVTTTETDPASVIPSFEPEKAEVIELGLKSEWFDRRLRLNFAGFVTDYNDLQITVLIGGFTPTVQNAGDARLKGVELESEFVPSSRLRFNLSAGYLENEYRRVIPEAVAQGVTLDNKLVNAPEWTMNAGTTVSLFDFSSGSLSLRADYLYRDAMFKDPRTTRC